MSPRKQNSFHPQLTELESREVPAITAVQLSGGVLTVSLNKTNTNVLVTQSSSTLIVKDVTNNATWTFAESAVSKVVVNPGAGNDALTATASNPNSAKEVQFLAGAGTDTLMGVSGPVSMVAGAGNDSLLSETGNDTLIGGSGTDTLQGGSGNDLIKAGTGTQYLNGGTGTATLYGGVGDDTIVGMNGGITDSIVLGLGPAVLWVDSNNGVTDPISGNKSRTTIQAVASFANGASRVLNGGAGTITEPTPLPANATTAVPAQVMEAFTGRPLFASGGPTTADIKQYVDPNGLGAGKPGTLLADTWLLAGLGSVVQQNPTIIEQNVVNFNDGTYGVKLGNNFYRVTNELPVTQYGVTYAAYASVGVQNSVWVPILEKAFTYLLTPGGQPTYAALQVPTNQVTTFVFKMFGATNVGAPALNNALLPVGTAGGYATQIALGQAIENFMNAGDYLAVNITTFGAGSTVTPAPAVVPHAYTITGYTLDITGNVATVTLQDPQGSGGVANPTGIYTVPIASLFLSTGTLDYGT